MGDVVEFAGVVAVIMGAVFGWKYMSVWLKRIDRNPKDSGKLRDIEERLAEMELRHDERLGEMEERLDFTERLLAQRREHDLPPPPEDR